MGWCISCLGPTTNANRICDVCSDYARALEKLMKQPQGRRVILSPLRRRNFDVFDLCEEAKVQCPISCGNCCTVWHQIKELSKDNVLEVVRGNFTEKGKCPHMTESGCALALDKRPLSCSTFLCNLGKWVHGGKLPVKIAKRLLAAADGDSTGASRAYVAANGNIEEALRTAEDSAAQMRVKVTGTETKRFVSNHSNESNKPREAFDVIKSKQ